MYINTADNPADVASRGVSVEAFLWNKTWVSGPLFLWGAESDWPVKPVEDEYLSLEDPEVKEISVNVMQTVEHPTTRLIQYFFLDPLEESSSMVVKDQRLFVCCCQEAETVAFIHTVRGGGGNDDD